MFLFFVGVLPTWKFMLKFLNMLFFGILLNNIIISNIVFLFILPKVEKELLSIVLSPLNPLYLPTTWGYPQDPFEKIVENLLDFLLFLLCFVRYCYTSILPSCRFIVIWDVSTRNASSTWQLRHVFVVI